MPNYPAVESLSTRRSLPLSELARLLDAALELETITTTQLATLLVLLRCADASGVCWPSVATIGRRAKLGRTSTKAALRALEELELVALVELGGVQGERKRPNVYRVNLQRLAPM